MSSANIQTGGKEIWQFKKLDILLRMEWKKTVIGWNSHRIHKEFMKCIGNTMERQFSNTMLMKNIGFSTNQASCNSDSEQ